MILFFYSSTFLSLLVPSLVPSFSFFSFLFFFPPRSASHFVNRTKVLLVVRSFHLPRTFSSRFLRLVGSPRLRHLFFLLWLANLFSSRNHFFSRDSTTDSPLRVEDRGRNCWKLFLSLILFLFLLIRSATGRRIRFQRLPANRIVDFFSIFCLSSDNLLF